MKIRFKGKVLGTISEVFFETPEFYGKLKLNREGKKFLEFLLFVSSRESMTVEKPPFNPEMLDWSNWDIMDDKRRLEIAYLVITKNAETVLWR